MENRYKPCGADLCCYTNDKDYVEKLEQERDQLRARVAELEGELQYLKTQYSNCGCGHPSCRMCQDQRETDELLNRTPAQSLAAIREQTLRDEVKVLDFVHDEILDQAETLDDARAEIVNLSAEKLKEADRVEQEGKV